MYSINNNNQKGFIALMSTIIISAIFLVITTTLAQSGWNLRYSILGTEMKSMSFEIAEGCANLALVTKLSDLSYDGDTTVTYTEGSCTILPIEQNIARNELTLHVTAVVGNSFTTLEYIYDVQDLHVSTVPLSSSDSFSSANFTPTLLSRREI